MKVSKRAKRLAACGAASLGMTAGFTAGWTLSLHKRFRSGLAAGAWQGVRSNGGNGRSIETIASRLRTVPFAPEKPYLYSLAAAFGPDLLPMSLDARRATAGYVYPYPAEFEKVTFSSLDGTPLVGMVGLHKGGRRRPGVVFSHGLFGSKNQNYVLNPALEAFSGWGYNVMTLDLRNFGESQKLSHSPTTGGWKEGQDILAACKFLAEKDEVTSVAAVGYSLGAGSVMNAAYQNREHPYLTGGAVAWNGYASMKRMVEYISTRPPVTDMFFPVYLAFSYLHEKRRQDMRRYVEMPTAVSYLDGKPFSVDFRRYMSDVVAPYYGRDEDEIYELSSPVRFISEVETPLLIVHAEDDPICPISEMEKLAEAVRGNVNTDIWVLPTGSHCAFDGFDRRWYWTVLREYLDYWAEWEQEAPVVMGVSAAGKEK